MEIKLVNHESELTVVSNKVAKFTKSFEKFARTKIEVKNGKKRSS